MTQCEDPARTLCSNPNCLELARIEWRDRAAAAGGSSAE
jgi:hypothetical protein